MTEFARTLRRLVPQVRDGASALAQLAPVPQLDVVATVPRHLFPQDEGGFVSDAERWISARARDMGIERRVRARLQAAGENDRVEVACGGRPLLVLPAPPDGRADPTCGRADVLDA